MAPNTQQVEGLVLHTKGYTDSKLLVSIFSDSLGRFSGVLRSSKRQLKPSPFIKYYLDISGSGDLKTIRAMETLYAHPLSKASGPTVFCGIYLNELIMRTVPEAQPFAQLYKLYDESVAKLSVADESRIQEVLLRRFEFLLLRELGLGLSFERCIDQQKIEANDTSYYRFLPGPGFQRVQSGNKIAMDLFSGAQLAAIAQDRWDDNSLRAAKRLARSALRPLLGDKPIKARELFS